MIEKKFIISHYGQKNKKLLRYLEGKNHLIYLKDDEVIDSSKPFNVKKIDNVGYNIYTYLHYIISDYHKLPEVVVFCKNNTFPRHVSEDIFFNLVERNVFTSIEDPSMWTLKYPVTMLSSDNGFLELNNSWYISDNPSKYFTKFNDFFEFIFDSKEGSRYLRFAPGANYVVPRECILLRSKEFYINLMKFVSHCQLSGESHMVERSLHAIWNSTLVESKRMKVVLTDKDLLKIMAGKKSDISRFDRFKNHWYIKILNLIDTWIGVSK